MRNAFTPMALLTVAALPSLLYFAHLETGTAKAVLLGCAVFLIVSAVVLIFLLAWFRPSLLRSEDWLLRQEGLDLLRTKSGTTIRVHSSDIARIAIERPGQLESGDDK